MKNGAVSRISCKIVKIISIAVQNMKHFHNATVSNLNEEVTSFISLFEKKLCPAFLPLQGPSRWLTIWTGLARVSDCTKVHQYDKCLYMQQKQITLFITFIKCITYSLWPRDICTFSSPVHCEHMNVWPPAILYATNSSHVKWLIMLWIVHKQSIWY